MTLVDLTCDEALSESSPCEVAEMGTFGVAKQQAISAQVWMVRPSSWSKSNVRVKHDLSV